MDYWDKRWDKDAEEDWNPHDKDFWSKKDGDDSREGSREGNQYRPIKGKKMDPSRKFSLDFLSKFQKQSIAAVLLFFVVLAAKYNGDITSTLVLDTFKGALSAQSDYSMALSDWVRDFAVGDKLVSGLKGREAFLAPVSGTVVNRFGWQVSGSNKQKVYNTGIDLAAPLGSTIQAPQDGKVSKVGIDAVRGKYITIEHSNGYSSFLGNFAQVGVKAQQQVKKGDPLGTLGLTSAVKRPWFFWEVLKNNQPIDPETLFSKSTQT